MKRKASADSSAEEPSRPRRTHHHMRHSGPYFDIDGDFDIVYGDGTPASLTNAPAEPSSGSWQSEHSPWDAVRASWESMWQQNPTPPGAARLDDGAETAGPARATDGERT